jgi:hypothetical protein
MRSNRRRRCAHVGKSGRRLDPVEARSLCGRQWVEKELVDADDARASATQDSADPQHLPEHRSRRGEPNVVMEIEIVDGDDAARLAQQQAKPIMDVLTWQQAQRDTDHDDYPPDTVT